MKRKQWVLTVGFVLMLSMLTACSPGRVSDAGPRRLSFAERGAVNRRFSAPRSRSSQAPHCNAATTLPTLPAWKQRQPLRWQLSEILCYKELEKLTASHRMQHPPAGQEDEHST
jgi:hypothetical protein